MKHFLIKLIIAAGLIAPAFAFAANPAVIQEYNWDTTPSSYHAFFTITRAPSSQTVVWASIGDVATGTWIKRDIRLTTLDRSTTVPTPLDVIFNYSDYGIQSGKKYVYYLADGDGSTEPNYLTSAKCFDTIGQVSCGSSSSSGSSSASNGDDYYYGQSTGTGTATGAGTGTGSASSNTEPFKVTEIDPRAPSSSSSYYFPTWKYSGTPTKPIKTFIWLKNITTDNWVRTNLSPQEFPANVPADKTVSFNFIATTYALSSTDIYAYYIGDSMSEPVNFLTDKKCFNKNGSIDCDYKPATVEEDPNKGGGTGTATTNLAGSAGTGGALVKGECGSISGGTTSIITSTSANLCKSGSVSGFTGSGPWSWICAGANGGSASGTCTAEIATDENLGDNFLKNPLAPGLDTFPKIFAAIVNNIVLPIAVPFIVIMLIYTGFLFVKARGKPEDLKEAKEALKYTLIGAGIVLASFVIANAIQATVSELVAIAKAGTNIFNV